MLNVKVSVAARRDLKNVLRYSVETFGEAAADEYAAELDDAFARIALQPQLGRAFQSRGPMLWRYNCGSHVIFFERTSKNIVILRVLHEATDFLRHLPK